MGFITTLVANNDFIHQLPKIKNLGEQIRAAISHLAISQPVHVGTSGIAAIESHHADHALLVMVGGGTEATVIKSAAVSYHSKNPELEFLKQLANIHGFDLHKRRK